MGIFKRKRIGEILSGLGFIKQDVIEQEVLTAKGRLGQWLVGRGLVNAEQAAQALAEQFEIKYTNLENFTMAPELLEKCSVNDIYRLGFVPYGIKNGVMAVVISDPLNFTVINEITLKYGMETEFLIASEDNIKAALEKSGTALRLLNDVSTGYKKEEAKEKNIKEKTITISGVAVQEGSIEKLINTILLVAMKKRASDIHFEVYEGGVRIKYRIDGILCDATENLDTAHHSAFITRIKVMAKLDIAESRQPQDGQFTLNMNGRDTDFRVSILPAAYGEDVVIRILDKAAFETLMKTMTLESIGFEPMVLARLRKSIHEPYGMILVTGPTGSGKTTTLYSAVSELNSGEEKIITIEDPVEYRIKGIVQIPVNERKKLTFAAGLRSILRHDPDKIVVGEIRDPETASIAVQSALTGHLVFTTVHANNACDVTGRFAHMGINVNSFVTALNCVVAQRLLRNICTHCKKKVHYTAEEMKGFGLEDKKYKNITWYEGEGCEKCGNTGYLGRSAVCEYMEMTPKLRMMIATQATSHELSKAAVEEGMITLRQAALKKAINGETSLKEVSRVTFAD